MASSDVPAEDGSATANVPSDDGPENLATLPAQSPVSGDRNPDITPQEEENETTARPGSAEDGDATQPEARNVSGDGNGSEGNGSEGNGSEDGSDDSVAGDAEEGTPPTTAKLTPKDAAWASSKVMDELRILQDKLAEIKRHAGAKLDYKTLAAEWDEAKERLGFEREQEYWETSWEERMNMSMEDSAAQFHGQRWFSRVDQDFSRRMEEKRKLDEELLRHRMRWEGQSPDYYPRRRPGRDGPRSSILRLMEPPAFNVTFRPSQDSQGYFHELRQILSIDGDVSDMLREWRDKTHDDIEREYDQACEQFRINHSLAEEASDRKKRERDRLHNEVERAFDRGMNRQEIKERSRADRVRPSSPSPLDRGPTLTRMPTFSPRTRTPPTVSSGGAEMGSESPASWAVGDTPEIIPVPPLFDEPEVVAPTPDHAISKLNPVKWDVFKNFRAYAEKDRYAIDVLDGEPVIVWDNWDPSGYISSRYSRSARLARGHRAGQAMVVEHITAPQPPESLHVGQALLPERIRINSSQLLQVLAKIHGSGFESVGGQSHVLIRPFKVLAHYETELRKWYKKLEKKFMPAGSDSKKSMTKDPATDALDLTTKIGASAEAASEAKNPTAVEGEGEGDGEGEGEGDEDPNDDTTSPVAFDHLGCLLKFMDTDIASKLQYLGGHGCRKIAFDDLWHIFQPGIDVIGMDGKQAYRVLTMVSSGHRVIKPFRDRYDDLDSANLDETPIVLNCAYLDFNGREIGPVQVPFEIKRFENLREVTSLPVFPLRFHPLDKPPFVTASSKKGAKPKKETDKVAAPEPPMAPGERLRQYLIARGERFLRAAAVEHMNYEGPAIEAREDAENQVTVESQVMVDFQTTFSSLEDHVKLKELWPPSLSNLTSMVAPDSKSPAPCKEDCCRGVNVHDDMYVDNKRNSKHLERLYPKARDMPIPVLICPRPLEEINTEEYFLDESDMVIMSYRVFGFVLRSRKWAKLDLSYLSEIENPLGPNKATEAVLDPTEEEKLMAKTAFGRLVLPEGHKTLVRSLTAQHFRDKKDPSRGQTGQVDIVRGKGKGLIILLHGAPGVGKTTTAEGVAELFRKPLFQITCGDLGTTSTEVEKALETNFDLANKWDCILLLDEADVFLAARTKADFQRNGLVAVFLRVLEYYAGILFLTTNRIGDFDEAFASRIHISLYYPPLDRQNTLDVFTLNLKLIDERITNQGRTIKIDWVTIGDSAGKHYDKHKSARWNGRQIRNACQTALALAEFQAQGNSHTTVLNANAVITLDITHFDVVFKAYRKFKRYLKRVYGVHDDQRANEAELRALEDASGGETGTEDYKDGLGPRKKKKNALQAMKKGKGKGKDKGREAESQPAIPAQHAFPGPSANPSGIGVPSQYTSYAAPPPPPTQPGYSYTHGSQYSHTQPPNQPMNPGPSGYHMPHESQNFQPQQPPPPQQQGWGNYGVAPPNVHPSQSGQGQGGGGQYDGGEHHGWQGSGHPETPGPPPRSGG